MNHHPQKLKDMVAATKNLQTISIPCVPIAEIALRVGFASQGHFTTTFRKVARTTPKAFREML